MKLGAFDLMVAKTFSPAWNLRDKWDEARENFAELAPFFEDDGMPLLQSIALLSDNNLRQSAVLNLSTAAVRNRWDATAEAADQAVRFLRQHCGVVRRDFMPYPNMIAPLDRKSTRLNSSHTDIS